MGSVEQSIDLEVPVSTAYDRWTQFEEFPAFMKGVKEIRQLDDTHLHWKAEIAGHVKEWDAEITEQHPDERVAWKAVDGSPNSGVVTFHRLSDTQSRLMVQIEHEEDGVLEKVGSALGADTHRVKGDLERFKELVEAQGANGGWRGDVEAGS
jgi:uncharacterized membrane protein